MTSPTICQLALKAAARVLALLALCVALSLMHRTVRPFQRRFFCDDQSILYPRGKCTVPYSICVLVGVVAACLAVATAEWGPARVSAARKPPVPRRLRWLMSFARRALSGEFKAWYFSQALYSLYYFCLGLAACDFLIALAKNVFGRHRPFFYAICRPEFPGGGGCNASVAYDVAEVCRPAPGDAHEFLDAQRSFPSGHSSFGLYCATFIVLYLSRRGRALPTVPRLATQFTAAVGGLYVAYSRVPDYKHHWSDVLAGGLLGVCLAWAANSAVPPSAVELVGDHLDVDHSGGGARVAELKGPRAEVA